MGKMGRGMWGHMSGGEKAELKTDAGDEKNAGEIWGKWGVAYGGTWVGERKQNSKQMPAMCGETGGATYWGRTQDHTLFIASLLVSSGRAPSTPMSRLETEMRTLRSQSVFKISGSRSRKMRSPSAIRNSPPEPVAS